METRRTGRISAVVALLLVAAAVTRAAAQEIVPSGQGWQISGVFPKSEPGPLEQRAKPVTPENPIPRRTRTVSPPYPAEAASVGVRAAVTLRVTVDHLGTVGEVRTVGVPVIGAIPPGTVGDEQAFRGGLLALIRSATDAVGQWVYQPPADPPMAFDVVIRFDSGSDGEVVSIPELDEAAIEAVKQWEFTPTVVNGVPSPFAMTLTIQFSLR